MRDVAEFDVSDFENPNSEKGIYAKFYFFPVEDTRQSAEAGRPVFVDKEFVEIIAAGNQNNIVRRPVGRMDIDRFPRQYALFKQGDAEQMIGTPLTEVPWVTRAQVEEFAYRKIRTLENLAEMSDAQCNAPGMYDMKNKAKSWLQKANEAAPFTAMHAEMDALRAELAALKVAPKAAKG
jgi:acyl-CoA-binding protein